VIGEEPNVISANTLQDSLGEQLQVKGELWQVKGWEPNAILLDTLGVQWQVKVELYITNTLLDTLGEQWQVKVELWQVKG